AEFLHFPVYEMTEALVATDDGLRVPSRTRGIHNVIAVVRFWLGPRPLTGRPRHCRDVAVSQRKVQLPIDPYDRWRLLPGADPLDHTSLCRMRWRPGDDHFWDGCVENVRQARLGSRGVEGQKDPARLHDTENGHDIFNTARESNADNGFSLHAK